MLIGGHAPTQGWTDRARQASQIFGDQIILWLPSETPQDALQHPGCVHLVRLDNWTVDITPAQYVANVTPQVTRWQSVAPLIFVLGNEPDIEAGHNGEQIARYAAAMKAAFPGILIGNPPLSVERSSLVNAKGCDVVLMHSYFERQHPESMTDRMFGRSYRYGLIEGAWRPVYVTEFNVVQENCPIDWPDRNKQAAAWLDQAEVDGVAGVCFFILDGQGEWASFDVGPEAAADILAHRAVRPAPAPPPAPTPNPGPPAPTPRTEAYTRDYDPRHHSCLDSRWEPFIAQHNPEEGDLICACYDQACEAIGYDANAAIAQGCVETAVFTSSRWRNARNAAGIGIYADSTPDVQFGSIERGIHAQIELLSDYYGTGMEPWGVLKEFGFGGMRLNKATLRGLDGVWAEDESYSQAIVGYLNQVLGGDAPMPDPAPAPVPQSAYRFVEPVDAPILQGSDGVYSHAGSRPGSVFYALDYGAAFGTPARCVADGTVIYNGFNHPLEGQTGHTICVQHADGYESRYCHLSEYDTPEGATVTQGQIIAHTGAPDYPYPGANGFGQGAHIHFSISLNGHWVRCEELMTAGEMGPWQDIPKEDDVIPNVTNAWDDGLLQAVWQSLKAPVYNPKTKKMGAAKAIIYNPQSGFFHEWVQRLRASQPIGVPCTQEIDWGDGRITQTFTSGRMMEFNGSDGSLTVK